MQVLNFERSTKGSDLLQLRYFARLVDSPAHGCALAAHAELYQRGWSDVPVLTGQERVLYAVSHNVIVGLVAWTEDPEESVWWVALSWVDPACRRRGVYSALWAHLVAVAQHEQVRRLEGGCHVANHAMNAAAKASGRRHVCNWYSYTVPTAAHSGDLPAGYLLPTASMIDGYGT